MKKSKVVFISGHFNILHPGHQRLFRFAKERGEKLVVAVESDRIAGNAAYIPEQLRLEGVINNSWIDEAFVMDESITETLAKLKPELVVKGREHESRFNREFDIVQSYGGNLIFSSGESVFSSVDLLRKETQETNFSSISIPIDFLRRHDLSIQSIHERLKNFNDLNVCVLGDVIIDEYITCQPLGMSQEDPTIVVSPIDSTKFIGGAGIVAAHAAGLGANVKFVTVVGNDDLKDYTDQTLKEFGVDAKFIIDESRPTTLKQRFRSKGKTLLRVSHLMQNAISKKLQKQFIDTVQTEIDKCDLLVFSDFNYGCLPQSLVDQICEFAEAKGIMMVADSQSSSQIGDIGRFKGMNLLTPTEREARISTKNNEDGLVVLAENLRSRSNAKNVILKLGEEGLLIHAEGDTEAEWYTDKVPALNSSPKDVAGAGDSLLISAAMTLASNGNIWEASFIGSLAASVQVGRVGNRPLKTEELLQELL